jgi:hypothetical protein
MTRMLYCEKCGSAASENAEDKAEGWLWRKVSFVVTKPADHFRIVNGVKEELSSIGCDRCGDDIPDGKRVFGITMWRPQREDEPGPWETEYQTQS